MTRIWETKHATFEGSLIDRDSAHPDLGAIASPVGDCDVSLELRIGTSAKTTFLDTAEVIALRDWLSGLLPPSLAITEPILAKALLDSGFIRRYIGYADMAYPMLPGIAHDGSAALAAEWAHQIVLAVERGE